MKVNSTSNFIFSVLLGLCGYVLISEIQIISDGPIFGETIDKTLIYGNLKMDIQPKIPAFWPVKPWGHKSSNLGNMGLSEGLLPGSRL